MDPWTIVMENRGLLGAFIRQHGWAMAGLDSEDREHELLLAMHHAAETWDPALGPFGPWAWLTLQNRARLLSRSVRRHTALPLLQSCVPAPGPSPEREVQVRHDAEMVLRQPVKGSTTMQIGVRRLMQDPDLRIESVARQLGVTRQRLSLIYHRHIEQLRRAA